MNQCKHEFDYKCVSQCKHEFDYSRALLSFPIKHQCTKCNRYFTEVEINLFKFEKTMKKCPITVTFANNELKLNVESDFQVSMTKTLYLQNLYTNLIHEIEHALKREMLYATVNGSSLAKANNIAQGVFAQYSSNNPVLFALVKEELTLKEILDFKVHLESVIYITCINGKWAYSYKVPDVLGNKAYKIVCREHCPDVIREQSWYQSITTRDIKFFWVSEIDDDYHPHDGKRIIFDRQSYRDAQDVIKLLEHLGV